MPTKRQGTVGRDDLRAYSRNPARLAPVHIGDAYAALNGHFPQGVGFTLTAYLTDYRAFGDAHDFMPSLDASRSMHNLDSAAHEWIGLVGYSLTGKTDAVFPAP